MILLWWIVQIYTWVLIARLALGWFTIPAEGPLASLYQAVYAATEPVLAPVRSVVRPVQMGSMSLDLSAMVVLLGFMLLGGFLRR